MIEDKGANLKYRVFKLSINVLIFHYYENSKPYKITGWWNIVTPAISYSLLTLLLGFLGVRIMKSIEAIHINLTGGEDYSSSIEEFDYDDYTNLIWNNLARSTSQRIDRRGVELLIAAQEDYMTKNDGLFSDGNTVCLKNALMREGYRGVSDEDIRVFFEAISAIK